MTEKEPTQEEDEKPVEWPEPADDPETEPQEEWAKRDDAA